MVEAQVGVMVKGSIVEATSLELQCFPLLLHLNSLQMVQIITIKDPLSLRVPATAALVTITTITLITTPAAKPLTIGMYQLLLCIQPRGALWVIAVLMPLLV